MSCIKIPIHAEDQNAFYAQFCYDLQTIPEASDSVSQSFQQLDALYAQQKRFRFQSVLEKKVQICQENQESIATQDEIDDEKQMKFPSENKPKFINAIIKKNLSSI